MAPDRRPLRLGRGALLLAAAALIAVALAPFASAWPDGLESVAARLGIAGDAAPRAFPSPFADYRIGGLPEPWSTVLAGVVGVACALAVGAGVGYLLRTRGRDGTRVSR